MTGPRILLNMGNLRSGGGLQVGSSFLDEVAGLTRSPWALDRWPWLASETVVEASPEVITNATADLSLMDVRVVGGGPLASVARSLSEGRAYDVAFTIFGPDYSRRRSVRRIVGFADGTSLYPEDAAQPASLPGRVRRLLRRRVSRTAFRMADRLVVESSHLVGDLRSRWAVSAPISVVPNVVNAVFHDGDAQEDVTLNHLGSPRILFPTRAHSHKNLPFLGSVARDLARQYGRRVTFVLTLTQTEWDALPAEVHECSANVGPVRVSQLPSLYRASDATIFPSLLESQSVTPLEALTMGSPLLASDRPFVRGDVGDAAWYFDPCDPASAADAVHSLLSDRLERERRRRLGLELMATWPTAAGRAASYLDIVSEELALARATLSR